MACNMEEAEIYKCPTHPSKRRRTGICPTCLRDRLNALCPDCANVRPCACCPAATTSSSSSSSSSFSIFSSGVGSVGRVSNLIDSEPSLRRSRSLAIPFLRSRSRFVGNVEFSDQKPPTGGSITNKTASLLSFFKTSKSKKGEEKEIEGVEKASNDYGRMMMMNRSRSVSVAKSLNTGIGEVKRSSSKRRWHFPSPIKAFRQSKAGSVVQERSPVCIG